MIKIVLCCLLIVIGIYNYTEYLKRRKNEKNEIVRRAAANFIIAKDALVRLLIEERISFENFEDAISHLSNNTIDIVFYSCGDKYVEEIDYLIKSYLETKQKRNYETTK